MFSTLSFLRPTNVLTLKPIQTFCDIWKRKPNVIFKPFTVSAGDAVFSAVPIKGKYGSKQDYITVIKNGCMLAEVIPQSRDAASGRTIIEYNKRVNVAMSLSNTGQILAISDQALASKDIHTHIEYTLQSDQKKKTFDIYKKLSEDIFTFKISESVLDGKVWKENTLQVQVPLGDFIVFRELCKYSLPYLIGWQALNSYDYAEKDSNDERI